jgi:hypothetical protein
MGDVRMLYPATATSNVVGLSRLPVREGMITAINPFECALLIPVS